MNDILSEDDLLCYIATSNDLSYSDQHVNLEQNLRTKVEPEWFCLTP
jgi:hypothetical protein